MKPYSLTFIIVLVFLCPKLFGQYPYEYLKKHIEYTFHSQQSKYDGYLPPTFLVIECKKRIRILNQEGVDRWSTFQVPEPIDPTYYDIISKARQNPFYLDNSSLIESNISISKRGKNIEVPLEQKISGKVFSESKMMRGDLLVYQADLKGLEVGDEIKINYKISVPISENIHELGSFRVLFHDYVPTADYQLKLTAHESAFVYVNYVNQSEPHASFKKDQTTDKWDFDTLAPLLAETNVHWYEEIPHLEIITSLDNLIRINNPRYGDIAANREAVLIGSTYHKYVRLHKFLQDYKERYASDSLALLSNVMNDILHFKYDPDDSYFKGEQHLPPVFGDDLELKRIRESNKYELYCAVLDGLGYRYMILTPMDKRIGQFSNQYARPNYSSENLIGVMIPPRSIFYIHPKSNQCGYFLDELPFYFENTKATVNYTGTALMSEEDFERAKLSKKLGWEIQRPMMALAGSSESDNKRNTVIRVVIDENNRVVNCTGRTSLSGQFSTVTRSLYACDEQPSFVDPQYTLKVFERIAGAQNAQIDYKNQVSQFPYSCDVDFSFSTDSFIEIKNDSVYLNLRNWVKHIDYQVNTHERTMAYYHDFKQTDAYAFQIELPKPIIIKNLPEPIRISNQFGTYTFQVSASETSIQVLSRLVISNEKVNAADIDNVSEIFNAIQNVECLELSGKFKQLD